MTNKSFRTFRATVRKHFLHHGRRLPWRPPFMRVRRDGTLDPYRVLVSEVMLQQTPVARAIPVFRALVRRFPTFTALARAERRDVLALWQGLGYNRRALFLGRAAELIMREHGGRLPRDLGALEALPGIGPYTARAVLCFAFNEPVAMVETNIRAAFIRHFFDSPSSLSHGVDDREILPLIEKTLDRRDPRSWYYALMDYGAHIKATEGNPNRRSAGYARQARFQGSDREIRGRIVKALIEEPRGARALAALFPSADRERVHALAAKLVAEGLAAKKGGILTV